MEEDLQVANQDSKHVAQPVLACHQVNGYKSSWDIERLQVFVFAVSAAWRCYFCYLVRGMWETADAWLLNIQEPICCGFHHQQSCAAASKFVTSDDTTAGSMSHHSSMHPSHMMCIDRGVVVVEEHSIPTAIAYLN